MLVDDSRAHPIPTIEIYQAATSRSLLFQSDRNIVAIATDTPIASGLPQLGIDDAAGVSRFILRYLDFLRKPKATIGNAL